MVVAGDDHGPIDAYWRAANYLSVGQIYLHLHAPRPSWYFSGLRSKRAPIKGLAGDGDISAARSEVPTLVIRAREDLEMARQAGNVLAG